MLNNNILNRIGDNILLLPIFYAITAPFFILKSVSFLPYVLLFTLLISYSLNKKTDIKKQICNLKPVLIAVVLYISYLILESIFQDYSSSRLRTFIYCFLFILLANHGQVKNKSAINYLFLISNLASFSYIFYVRYMIHIPKKEWIITASTISAITVTITLLSILTLAKNIRQKKAPVILLSITATLGVLSSLMSITRSGWVALIVLSIYISYKNGLFTLIKKRYFALFLLICVVILEFIIKDRILQTYNDLRNISSGNFVTSIGLRLEMWRSAIILSQENILFGIPDTYKTLLVEYAKSGVIHPIFKTWIPNHFHSEYFDRLVKMGVVGLSVFFYMLFCLLKIARKKLGGINHVQIIILSLLLAGITDRSFELIEVIPVFLLLSFYYLGDGKQSYEN